FFGSDAGTDSIIGEMVVASGSLDFSLSFGLGAGGVTPALVRVDLGSGALTRMSAFDAGPAALYVAEALGQLVVASVDGIFLCVVPICPTPTRIAPSGGITFGGVATDGTFVYWTTYQLSGAIYQCALPACANPVAIAGQQAAPGAVR